MQKSTMVVITSGDLKNQRIDNTQFTVGWILKALDENDTEWKRISAGKCIKNVSSEVISNAKGFMSRIYKLTMSFDRGDPYCVVLKAPTTELIMKKLNLEHVENKAVEQSVKEALAFEHNRECYIYANHHNCGMPMPKIYAIQTIIPEKQDGAILMEYFGDHVCNVPYFISFNIEQLIYISCCLARLHAYSMSLTQEEIKKLNVAKDMVDSWVNIFNSHSEAIVKKCPSMRQTYDKLKHLMITKDYIEYCLFATNKELGMKPVIVHGDLWANNIFMLKHDDGIIGKESIAFIDWQAAHCGCVGEDLARIYGGSNGACRREVENLGIDAYYTTFEEEMEKRNLPIRHSKEQVLLSYRRWFVCQALLILAGTKFLLPKEETIHKNMKHIWDARIEYLLLRNQLALNDALRIVEEDIPEWLNPNHRFIH